MAGSSTKRFPGKNRFGFTLIEVALGAAILAAGFIGMIDALILGRRMLDVARCQTVAAQVMQSEVEYWRMQPWSTVTGSSGLSNHSADLLRNYPEFASTNLAILTDPRYKFARTVTYVSGRSNQIIQLTMTVTWTGVTGLPHSRSMNAYIGKYGLNVTYRKM